MICAPDVTIIGGSLSGLTLALACACRGLKIHVLERARGPRRRGGTLGIDRSRLLQVIGKEAHYDDALHPFPLLAGRRKAAPWQVIYHWLRIEAQREPTIVLEDGVMVTEIKEDKGVVTAEALDGRRFQSPLVVGADGYQSCVRRAIDPGRHQAVYAGYLLWRGLVDETELPSGCLPRAHEEATLLNQVGHRLVAYAVAGPTGTLEPGRRLLSFTWYDSGQGALLRKLACVSGSGHVLRTLTEERVPAEVRDERCELARRIWPDPWRSVIIHAFARRQVFATPVAEYFPHRLHRGRLTIIGDAAHPVSPVTGQGFAVGMRDAASLADCLGGAVGSSDQGVRTTLTVYEEQRLADAQTLVSASRRWSEAFTNKKLVAASRRSSQRGIKKPESFL